MVVAIDAKRSRTIAGQRLHVAAERHRPRRGGMGEAKWSRRRRRDSADVDDRDGQGLGLRLRANTTVAESVRIPVIASGGAGGAQPLCGGFAKGRADAALAASIFHYGFNRLADLKRDLGLQGYCGEVAMLIPSIDLMGGKVVQLVQGKKKALEFDDAEEWISRFSKYPLVQLIDLDAAMGTGSNGALVSKIAGRLPCQVGGGIRTLQAAEEMLGRALTARSLVQLCLRKARSIRRSSRTSPRPSVPAVWSSPSTRRTER